ncbi:MAG: hypothetical protein Q9195_002508 [Heterodermia aff. obscurata]
MSLPTLLRRITKYHTHLTSSQDPDLKRVYLTAMIETAGELAEVGRGELDGMEDPNKGGVGQSYALVPFGRGGLVEEARSQTVQPMDQDQEQSGRKQPYILVPYNRNGVVDEGGDREGQSAQRQSYSLVPLNKARIGAVVDERAGDARSQAGQAQPYTLVPFNKNGVVDERAVDPGTQNGQPMDQAPMGQPAQAQQYTLIPYDHASHAEDQPACKLKNEEVEDFFANAAEKARSELPEAEARTELPGSLLTRSPQAARTNVADRARKVDGVVAVVVPRPPVARPQTVRGSGDAAPRPLPSRTQAAQGGGLIASAAPRPQATHQGPLDLDQEQCPCRLPQVRPSCRNYVEGKHCPYGDKCSFGHDALGTIVRMRKAYEHYEHHQFSKTKKSLVGGKRDLRAADDAALDDPGKLSENLGRDGKRRRQA